MLLDHSQGTLSYSVFQEIGRTFASTIKNDNQLTSIQTSQNCQTKTVTDSQREPAKEFMEKTQVKSVYASANRKFPSDRALK